MKIIVTKIIDDEELKNMTDDQIINYFWDELPLLVDNAEWEIIRK